MKDLDEAIRDALCDEDAKWFDELDEQSLSEMVADSFRGKSRWLVVLVYFCMIVYTCLVIFAAVRFFQTEHTREMIGWAAAFVVGVFGIGMLKVWYWMELNKNAVTREIKRFELQLARLSSRIDK